MSKFNFKVAMIIANKFNGLVYERLDSFTKVERAIWFIIILRTEKDMNGFHCIFEQAMQHKELVEAIEYLRTLGAYELANLFQQALDLLNAENAYSDGHGITNNHLSKILSAESLAKLRRIDEQVGDRLWDLDEALYLMLQEER